MKTPDEYLDNLPDGLKDLLVRLWFLLLALGSGYAAWTFDTPVWCYSPSVAMFLMLVFIHYREDDA